MTENNTQRGRQNLAAWEANKPTNFFTSDLNLQNVLRRHLGDEGYAAAAPNLTDFGGKAATLIDEACKVEDRIGNHPRLYRYNGIGERVEQIEFHPNHDVVGRAIWEARIMALQAEAGNTRQQMGLFYLLSHTADGHSCGLACTSGLIRALQTVADEAVREQFLPPLLDPDYDRMQHGAQFLTEVQGGSDVGTNAVLARNAGDGTWRITGEKWFCSNVNADQFLVMARPVNATDGTRGLGAFLIPRKLENGETNGFYLRRLKDKLGTRLLASAELDFVDAVAYPIGPVDAGFKNTVELVLNTSRLMNAVACAGVMRRAAIEAGTYACARQAFGSPIASYPLVQEAVADILSETYAATASSFALAALLDKIETGEASDDEKAVYRLFVNINKYITSIRGSEAVHRAIEVLGGNGAIESFSILPRLYRDMVVLESWEGTHNVLCLQVLRDIARYGLHEPFARFIRALLDDIHHERLDVDVWTTQEALTQALSLLGRIAGLTDDRLRQAHARRLADSLAHVAQAALLLAEADWELVRGLPTLKPEAATYFVNRRLRPAYDALDDADYLPRLEKLMTAF